MLNTESEYCMSLAIYWPRIQFKQPHETPFKYLELLQEFRGEVCEAWWVTLTFDLYPTSPLLMLEYLRRDQSAFIANYTYYYGVSSFPATPNSVFAHQKPRPQCALMLTPRVCILPILLPFRSEAPCSPLVITKCFSLLRWAEPAVPVSHS